MSYPKIQKKLKLNLSDIPKSQQAQAKKDVGEFIINEILRYTAKGESPVSGEGRFKTLDKDYAKEQKGGNRTPNLRLEGDLLEALDSRNNSGNQITIGIMKDSQMGKADGHCNFSGESKLPKRRFIPEEKQTFKQPIMRGIKEILDGYRETGPGIGITRPGESVSTTITLEDILPKNILDLL